jgi:hypothetical protein
MYKRILLSTVAVFYLSASIAIKSSKHIYGFQLYKTSTDFDFAITNFMLMIVYGPFNFLVVSWDNYLKSIIFLILFIIISAMTFYPLLTIKNHKEFYISKNLLMVLFIWFSTGFILSIVCAGLNFLGMLGNIGA